MDNCVSNQKYMSAKYRNGVLKRYDEFCPISGHRGELSDACHILERKDSLETFDKNDVLNGILLSKTLHTAFDKKYFTFDENTAKVKILCPDNDLQDIGLFDGKYVWQLDNEKSKYYLKLRNKVFT